MAHALVYKDPRSLLAKIAFFIFNGCLVNLPSWQLSHKYCYLTWRTSLFERLMSLILLNLSKLTWPNFLCQCRASFQKSLVATLVEWWWMFTSNLYNPCLSLALKRNMSSLHNLSNPLEKTSIPFLMHQSTIISSLWEEHVRHFEWFLH